MGGSLWNQVGLALLIGVAVSIVVTALRFLRVRLWNWLMKQIKPHTAVEETAHDQPLPVGDAVGDANAMEMGNGYGPAEGGKSMTEPEMEMRIVNGGEGLQHFSDQEAHPPVIEYPVTTPKVQVIEDVARGAPVQPVDMDVPHSQQEEAAAE